MYTKIVLNEEKLVKSKDIRVGDIILLNKNERVPADILLLYTSDPNGTLFVKTDQLDGETDWKVREATKFTQKIG